MLKNNNKIKVVFVTADSDFGGGSSHILGILRNIDRKKFAPYLICPKGYLATEARSLKDVKVFSVLMKSKFDIVAAYIIKNILLTIQSHNNPFDPMIVHTHGPRAHFLTSFVLPDQAKSVYTEHIYNEGYRLKNHLNRLVQKQVLKYLNNRTDLIIAVSKSVQKYLLDSKLAQNGKVIYIPNGIDSSNIAKVFGKKIKEVNLTPVIGTVGSLNRQKGQKFLVEAMQDILQKYPLASLEIIGGGEELNSLKSRVNSLKLGKHVSFLGRQKDIYKYMKDWDVFVLPSVSETFGIVALEAMACGIPVVATRTGGIIDIISDKKNGLLVDAKNSVAIAKTVIKLIDSPVLSAKLKREGMLRVKDFDWKKIVAKLENTYVALVKVDD